jgi:hypothetical protein
MKSQSYMTRALQARDPRFAQILCKLGYDTEGEAEKPKPVAKPTKADDMAELRGTYAEVVGKRPFNGWDADTLREKIAAAKKA